MNFFSKGITISKSENALTFEINKIPRLDQNRQVHLKVYVGTLRFTFASLISDC